MSSETSEMANPDLIVERDRLLGLIETTPRANIEDAVLPQEPGIYVLWPVNQDTIDDLRLSDVHGEPSLASRPLYVGKAEDFVRSRLADKVFASGDTGHSTVRRTLAALLDLESVPRRTRIVDPTPKKVQTLVTNFDLAEHDDQYLSRWMVGNLEVCGFASSFSPLKDLERAIGAVLRPPLDQERSPMWQPNPWRQYVAERRQILRERARSHL